MAKARYLYVHIPFCEVICHYCHFYTARAAEAGGQESFFAALVKHLAQEEEELAPELNAVYFGGGTPAASPPHLIAEFLEKLRPKIHAGTEITIEANPSNITAEKVAAWKRAGINRISLGVQSLDDATLKRLGRAHSSTEARAALTACAREIPNVSCDLIYSVPEQGADAPRNHALELARLGARHLSFYHLTLENDHFLHNRLPTDAFAWGQLRLAADAMEAEGYEHYEVASFALPGSASRNNLNYWSGGPYLALGPSAHGFDGEHKRWTHVSDWREYEARLAQGQSPRAWTETLTPAQRRLEILFTSLRTAAGLNLEEFQNRFGEDLLSAKRDWIQRWESEGLLERKGPCLVLTFRGKMLADEIVQKLA